MKKITFNALLNHKAHNYKPMQIEVEKVIPLYGKRFEQMRDHPLVLVVARMKSIQRFRSIQSQMKSIVV
jgi:hypothetical protein